jgi:hypothetical protein
MSVLRLIPNAADSRLAGTALECRDHRGEFLCVNREGTTATTTATACGSKTSLDALLRQGTFKLRQRPEDME